MGKKRVVIKSGETETKSSTGGGKTGVRAKISKAIAHIQATYNNTLITVTDEKGNALAWSSTGAVGFSGTKKATPFAAARVAEAVADKLQKAGIEEMKILVKGVGAGRESAIRALANRGFNIVSIKDITPIPHNGPRPKKPRRV